MRYVTNTQKGFSLVDVMVGMVISLIGVVIIFQVFETSESRKRTATSGGEAQTNGAIAMFTLERALREAGYGVNNASDFAAGTHPAEITVGAAAKNADKLIIVSRPWDYGPYVPVSAVYPAAVSTAYQINNNAQLVATVAGVDSVIADGIVQLKAQYGRDANGNNVIESTEWDTTAPGTGQWTSVLAVRLALVARSSQPEGKDPAACNTTTVSPNSSNGQLNLSANVGLANTDSWKCYRYKTYETTVPLRNVIWRP